MTELNQWAQMHDPAENRKKALADERDEAGRVRPNREPCKANGMLGKFGAGSKSAGFVYGKDVRAITCPEVSRGNSPVYELLLSETKFEERSKQNPMRPNGGANQKSWMNNQIHERELYDQKVKSTQDEFNDLRSETEQLVCVKELMQEVEKKKRPFTMLLISDIKSPVHGPLKFDDDNLRDLIRDLRDMYFVYTDSLHHCIHRTDDSPQENVNYRHGPLDLQVKVVRHQGGSSAQYDTIMHHSLRHGQRDAQRQPIKAIGPDGVPLEPLSLPNMTLRDDDNNPVPVTVDRLAALFEICAPELFRFSLHHKKLGSMEGIVLYLPCAGGIERRQLVQLHMDSKALVFWKGRLIPYACMTKLLPFMHWAPEKRGEKIAPQEREMQERTVLLLFLDGVTGVDTTKFKIHSDLEMHLSRYPKTNKNRDATGSVIAEEGGDFEFAYFWNDDDEQWVVGTADLPQVKPPEDVDRRIDRRNAVSLREKYKDWVDHCHSLYDKMVKLKQRVASRRVVEEEDEESRVIFDYEPGVDPWHKAIESAANSPIADFPQGLLGSEFRLPTELTFFKRMGLGTSVEHEADINGPLFKINCKEDSFLTSERLIERDGDERWEKGMVAFKPSSSGAGQRKDVILGKPVAFFVPTADCKSNHPGQLPQSYRGPSCCAIMRRYPLELFGGTYVVDSGAITPITALDAIKTYMEGIKKDLPETMSAAFVDESGDDKPMATGTTAANPLRLYADKPLPTVIVCPQTKGKQIVTDWTKDVDWVVKDRFKFFEPLTVQQTLEKRTKGSKEGEETWEPVESFKDLNSKGDPKKGYIFSTRPLAQPGEYRLTYSLQPIKSAAAAAAADRSSSSDRRGRGSSSSQAYPTWPVLKSELHVVIQPSLPCSMRVERIVGDDENKPLALWEKEKVRVVFAGRDDQEVQLSPEVQEKYSNLVTVAIRAQMDHLEQEFTVSADDNFQVFGAVVISKKNKKAKAAQYTGLGFDLNMTIVPFMSGPDISAKDMDDMELKELTAKYGKLLEEGRPPLMGKPPLPMGSFWGGSRSKAKDLVIKVTFQGVKVMYSLDGSQIFVQGKALKKDGQPTVTVCYDAKEVMNSAKTATSVVWPAGKKLPRFSPESFEFLGGDRSVTKPFKCKLVSNGAPSIVLSGPLADRLAVDNFDFDRSVENCAVLPKLTVSVLDEYGAFVPGAPGDMVRISCSDLTFEPQKLGPDGTATFDALMLSFPAAALKAKMHDRGHSQLADDRSTKSVHEFRIELFNSCGGGVAGASAAGEAGAASEGKAQGCDGCLANLAPYEAYLTVAPSSKPTQLTLMRDGTELAADETALLTKVAPLSEVAGRQLTGLTLRASNEVDQTMGGPGKPFKVGTRLLIDGDELSGQALESFLARGELPADHPVLRMPSHVRDGPRSVTIQLQLSKGEGLRSRTSAVEHTVELRLKLTPLPGPPHAWRLLEKPLVTGGGAGSRRAASAGQGAGGRGGGGGGAVDSGITTLQMAVASPMDGLRAVAIDELGNVCLPASLGGLTPVLKVYGDGDSMEWPRFLLPEDEGVSGENEVEMQLETTEEQANGEGGEGGGAQRTPNGSAAHTRTRHAAAAAGDPGGSAQEVPPPPEAVGEGRPASGGAGATRGFCAERGVRLVGRAGAWQLQVGDESDTLAPSKVAVTLTPGAPKALHLQSSSRSQLEKVRHPSRVRFDALRFQVHDLAGNAVRVDEFSLLNVGVGRAEGCDERVSPATAVVVGSAKLDDGLPVSEAWHAIEALHVRFDRMAGTPTAERPEVQRQRLTFKAKVKVAGRAGSIEVAADPVEVEANLAESEIVSGLALEMDDAVRVRYAAPVDAGEAFPEVGLAFVLEGGRTVSYDQLFASREDSGEPAASPAPRSGAAAGTSAGDTERAAPDSGGERVATRGQKRRADGSAAGGAAAEDAGGGGGGLLGALSAHLNQAQTPEAAARDAGGPSGAGIAADSAGPAARQLADDALTCTLHKADGGPAHHVTLVHIGSGRFRLREADQHFLDKAGEYVLSAEFSEPRASVREALKAVGPFEDECRLSAEGLLRFRVRAGRPAMIKMPKRAHVGTCNNTRGRTVVSPQQIELRDELGNPTSQAGLYARLAVRFEPPAASPLDPRVPDAPPTDPRLAAAAAADAAASQASASAAMAAVAFASAAAAGAAPADPAAASKAALQAQVRAPPTVSLPDPVPFDANGVAKLGAATIAANCEGEECMLVFDLELVGWDVNSMGEPPGAPPIRMKFENTHRMDLDRQRAREEAAERERQQAERFNALQHAHDADLQKMSELRRTHQQVSQVLAIAENKVVHCVQRAQDLLYGQHHDAHSIKNADLQAVRQQLQAQLTVIETSSFPGFSAIPPADERHLNAEPNAIGTFGAVFELAVPKDVVLNPDQYQKLAAVLSDQMGSETLKMVITQNQEAYQNLDRKTSFPRYFVLDMNQAAYAPTKPEKVDGIWSAYDLLQVNAAVDERFHQELRAKVLPKYVGGLLVARDERTALEYKQMLFRTKAKTSPNIVALDGFFASAQGHFGGSKQRKRTSLNDMRQSHKPFFGCTESNVRRRVPPLLDDIAQEVVTVSKCEQQLQTLNDHSSSMERQMTERSRVAQAEFNRQLVQQQPVVPQLAQPVGGGRSLRRSADAAQLAAQEHAAKRTRGGSY